MSAIVVVHDGVHTKDLEVLILAINFNSIDGLVEDRGIRR